MTDREPSTSPPYEVMPSDIAFEWFLSAMTPERAEMDRLPPEGSAERRRLEYLLNGREYYRQARLTALTPHDQRKAG